MLDFLKRIQHFQKLSGSREELESLAILRAEMDALGFRTQLLSHDAFISLPGKAYCRIGGETIDAITHSAARPSGPDGVTAPMVDLGAGTAADFARSDVAGKIVVVRGLATPAMADRASRAGALGQIHISDDDQRHEMCVSPVWGSPSAETLGEMPQTVVVTIGREEGARLAGRLAATPGLEATLFAEIDEGWRKTPILIADMDCDGAAAEGPFVLFSGHHDTWYEGVMDNGSANATMIETARILAGCRPLWQRSLRIAFWSGHSHGRYSGSTWYADNRWDELERRCVAHVNVDSTGGMGANVLTGSGSSAELRAIAQLAIRDHAGQNYEGVRHGRAGDESFWGIGIPSVFNSLSHQNPGTGDKHGAPKLGWWWHTAHDTLDKIDPQNLQRDTQVYLRVVAELLLRPLLPLDYRLHAAELGQHLEGLAVRLGDRLDLHEAQDHLARFSAALDGLAARAEAATDGAQRQRVNAALVRVSRALVPMDYTRGDRFAHDPALAQPAWPVLLPVQQLAGLQDGDPRLPYQATSARRALNRLCFALREAARAAAEPG